MNKTGNFLILTTTVPSGTGGPNVTDNPHYLSKSAAIVFIQTVRCEKSSALESSPAVLNVIERIYV